MAGLLCVALSVHRVVSCNEVFLQAGDLVSNSTVGFHGPACGELVMPGRNEFS